MIHAAEAADDVADPDPYDEDRDSFLATASSAAYAIGSREGDDRAAPAEQQAQADLLRDIFGSLPFRPVGIVPRWRTPLVLSLAQAAYQERIAPDPSHLGWLVLDPARLLVLADVLEDAGCEEQQILEHLRGTGEHVRGCFAMDLILGTESRHDGS